MTAALTALHDDRVDAPLGDLLGVAARADRRHDDHAVVLELRDLLAPGCERERRDPHPLGDQQVDPVVGVGRVGAQVDAERPVGALLDRVDRVAQLVGSVIVADARMPKPPAALVADVSRAPATQPMPVCTIGTSHPNSSVTRVCSA